MIERIVYKIRIALNRLYYSIKIKSFSKKAFIERPISIVNGKKVTVGECSFISKNVQIEAISKYNNKVFNPEIIIGNNVFIGQNTHIVATQKLKIGDDTTISDNVFISDCQHEYTEFKKSVLKQPLTSHMTEIGDGCFIGFGAVIEAGVILGDGCIVGSNAVCLKGKYEAGTVLVGIPARPVKKYDENIDKWYKC